MGSDTGGAADEERKPRNLHNLLLNFSPLWWSIPMTTGILGIILHQLPYNDSGLQICSTILYVFELVQVVVMGCLTLLRLALYPRSVKVRLFLRHTSALTPPLSIHLSPATRQDKTANLDMHAENNSHHP